MFHYCLNTSTIRGQELSLLEEIEIAANAGYDAIEPWINEIEAYQGHGGSLADLKKRISDCGLSVESAVGFAEWIVDDDTQRSKGLERARYEMDLVQQIGGKRIAAPAAGAVDVANINYLQVAERYRTLLEIGDQIGVVPQLEVWGFSKTLSRLGEAMLVAIESGHPQACILPDVYHLYKGGSDYTGLNLVNGSAIKVFHVNDYPRLPRESIDDSDRVYPGDGVAPLCDILKTLQAIGFDGHLSVELFNKDYWQQDPKAVVLAALEKTKELVQQVS